jgi:hypothetical protein
MILKRVIRGRLKQVEVSHFSLERCSFRFQIRGLYNLSWSAASIFAPVRHSIHLYFLARILVPWDCAHTWLSSPSDKAGCADGASWSYLTWTPSLSNVDLSTLTGDALYTTCFQAIDRLKETCDLPRPTVLILCLSSTLLVQLKVGPTKGKKVTNVSSSLGVFYVWGVLRAWQICLSLWPFF